MSDEPYSLDCGETCWRHLVSEKLEVIDLTDFVQEQRDVLAGSGVTALKTPVEHVYVPSDPKVCEKLGLTSEE